MAYTSSFSHNVATKNSEGEMDFPSKAVRSHLAVILMEVMSHWRQSSSSCVTSKQGHRGTVKKTPLERYNNASGWEEWKSCLSLPGLLCCGPLFRCVLRHFTVIYFICVFLSALSQFYLFHCEVVSSEDCGLNDKFWNPFHTLYLTVYDRDNKHKAHGQAGYWELALGPGKIPDWTPSLPKFSNKPDVYRFYTSFRQF